MEVDDHIVDVIFLLLDEDDNQRISNEEFNPILFQWRHSRGFAQASAKGAGVIELKL